MNLNKVFIIGRLTQDPELRTTPNGQQVVSFGVATNRYWTNQSGERQEMTEYHNLVGWGRLADTISKYLKKGSLAMFEGRLQTRSWEGQDGVKRYRTETVIENLQLGPRAVSSHNQSSPHQQGDWPTSSSDSVPTIQQDDITPPASVKQSQSSEDITIENIPF